MNTIEIKIDKKKYNLQRSNLRQWLHLEDIRSKIIEAAGNKDIELVVESMYSYISSAFGFNLDLEDLPWIQVVEIYAEISLLNAPKLDFPILKVRSKKDQIPSWDYEGRTWYFWSHMLARNYGWNLDYIANFSIDDGIAFIQEIMIDDQMKREWEWSLSEIAYSYNEKTKKSEFRELERPFWMSEQKEVKEPKKIKIRKDMLPIGNIISYAKSK